MKVGIMSLTSAQRDNHTGGSYKKVFFRFLVGTAGRENEGEKRVISKSMNTVASNYTKGTI